MSITKQSVIDQITITENGVCMYRTVTKIVEDGIVLAQTYHRTSLAPGEDLTGHPPTVAAICEVAWTPEVIATYKEAHQ
jgi:hypothetical protein